MTPTLSKLQQRLQQVRTLPNNTGKKGILFFRCITFVLYHIRALCLLIACQKSKNNCSTPIFNMLWHVHIKQSCWGTVVNINLARRWYIFLRRVTNLAWKWYFFLRRVTMTVLFVDRIFNPITPTYTFLKAKNYLLLVHMCVSREWRMCYHWF